MFGYISADLSAMEPNEKARYRQHYCGLCNMLSEKYGADGQSVLAYDMAFLSILLSSLYNLEEADGSRRCIMRPLKRQSFIASGSTDYAADMNIILGYYQLLDDWHDDRNTSARKKSRRLEPYLPKIREKYPIQCAAIENGLKALGEMERAGEMNADLPANCFGDILGALFAWRDDNYAAALYDIGASLGRFIYLMDATNDLRQDIKKQRYNPLASQLDTDFTPMLTMLMAECAAIFESLPISRDRSILQNHLYSGAWQKYRIRKKKGANA
ncbi:MAG: DUF5685 family protein [Christensenellales bacterium]|jgi:hypothetical protein